MMTHAYSQLYLRKASSTLGNMLHGAVVVFGMDGADILDRFIATGVAAQFEDGNPRYIAGKSGAELFIEVMEKTTDKTYGPVSFESYEKSPAYWVGWMLTHYQWYSGHSFKTILSKIPYEELIGLYGILHEADIRKSYEVLDLHIAKSESSLKTTRKICGLTQEELAKRSGVSLNTIRAYERKSKDLDKARFDIVVRLARALRCDVSELVDRSDPSTRFSTGT